MSAEVLRQPILGRQVDAPALRRCRACGCTDVSPCPNACFWVCDDLCSNCDDVAPFQEGLVP